MDLIADLVVVGAGHAGCEAALAASRLGRTVLVLTMNLDTIAQMSCNPAIGGLAKGQVVREIDALGGAMGMAADATGLQFKVLGQGRGPAARGPRAQCDKWAYQGHMKRVLESAPGVRLVQGRALRILVEEGRARGVETATGLKLRSRAVVLTTGTFLSGLIHIGDHRFPAGRAGEAPSTGLTEQLTGLGLKAGRLKTGTNPRVDRRSLDFSRFTPQAGDAQPEPFSHDAEPPTQTQLLCWSTRTHPGTHDAIRDCIQRSPLYNGVIQGVGPRYCPSIEDKVMRFPEKEGHQVFLEPEGRDTVELYLNGLSTSLPEADQGRFLSTLPGFERVHILRPGYAIEYDFFDPTQLELSLESRVLPGLYLAGQINGSSGYEEAAAQGLMAGLNAGRAVAGQAPWVLGRDQAWIGVLIDDLVMKGTAEPYRLFTSLGEHRLLLRADNADLRLMDLGLELGLLAPERHARFARRRESLGLELERLKRQRLAPSPERNAALAARGSAPLSEPVNLAELLKRPELSHRDLELLGAGPEPGQHPWVARQAETLLKAEGYIARGERAAARAKSLEGVLLPEGFDPQGLLGLSREARDKLARLKPRTLGQAGRISGVSPADLTVLWVGLRVWQRARSLKAETGA